MLFYKGVEYKKPHKNTLVRLNVYSIAITVTAIVTMILITVIMHDIIVILFDFFEWLLANNIASLESSMNFSTSL